MELRDYTHLPFPGGADCRRNPSPLSEVEPRDGPPLVTRPDETGVGDVPTGDTSGPVDGRGPDPHPSLCPVGDRGPLGQGSGHVHLKKKDLCGKSTDPAKSPTSGSRVVEKTRCHSRGVPSTSRQRLIWSRITKF